eukprot:364518-Chlamydomonas_euryale.AAC.1
MGWLWPGEVGCSGFGGLGSGVRIWGLARTPTPTQPQCNATGARFCAVVHHKSGAWLSALSQPSAYPVTQLTPQCNSPRSSPRSAIRHAVRSVIRHAVRPASAPPFSAL